MWIGQSAASLCMSGLISACIQVARCVPEKPRSSSGMVPVLRVLSFGAMGLILHYMEDVRVSLKTNIADMAGWTFDLMFFFVIQCHHMTTTVLECLVKRCTSSRVVATSSRVL